MAICNQCKKTSPEDMRFCGNCGDEVSKITQPLRRDTSANVSRTLIIAATVLAPLALIALLRTNTSEQQSSNVSIPSSVATPNTPEPTSTPFPIDNSWMWNDSRNHREIDNEFAEAMSFLGENNTKAKTAIRNLYKEFQIKADSKEGLRELSSRISTLRDDTSKLGVDLTTQAIIASHLDKAHEAIEYRITSLGTPSTGAPDTSIEKVPIQTEEVKVVYKIAASNNKRWSVTYTNERGDTEQITNGLGPWKKALLVPRGTHLYVSAQNGENWGGIYLSIEVNGETTKSSESQGAYCVASASYTVPDE